MTFIVYSNKELFVNMPYLYDIRGAPNLVYIKKHNDFLMPIGYLFNNNV